MRGGQAGEAMNLLIYDFEHRICFGFRFSCFEFSASNLIGI